MVSKSKKLILCLITLLLLLLCVVGCSNREALKNKNHATEDNQVTLRFLVENLNGRISAKRQIESWKRKFEKSHSNVEIILEELPLEAYKAHSELFEEDLYQDIDLLNCVEKRISLGGTSVASVQQQMKYVKERI